MQSCKFFTSSVTLHSFSWIHVIPKKVRQKHPTTRVVSVGVPGVPNVGLPGVPNVGVPRVPNVGVPRVPIMNVPRIPNVGVPRVFTVDVPRVPIVDVPRVPSVGVPRIPSVRPKADRISSGCDRKLTGPVLDGRIAIISQKL